MRVTIDEVVQRKTSKKRISGLNSKFLIQSALEITKQREKNGSRKEEKILLLQEKRENSERSQEESSQKEKVSAVSAETWANISCR
jgi:hypothetical protein